MVSDKWNLPHAHKKYSHPFLLPPFENTPTPLSKNTATGQNKHKNLYIRGNLRIYHILSMSKKRGRGAARKKPMGRGVRYFWPPNPKIRYFSFIFTRIFSKYISALGLLVKNNTLPRPIFVKNLAPLPPSTFCLKYGIFFTTSNGGSEPNKWLSSKGGVQLSCSFFHPCEKHTFFLCGYI